MTVFPVEQELICKGIVIVVAKNTFHYKFKGESILEPRPNNPTERQFIANCFWTAMNLKP